MPTAGKTISSLVVKIGADIQGLVFGTKKADETLKSFNARVSAASGKLKSMGTASIGVSAGLAAVGTKIMKTFAGFEQSMANVGSVVGASASQMSLLTGKAREMGAASVFSASEAADAMYHLGSAGYNTDQIVGSLKGTLDLAAATQHNLADTTRITVGTLNGFGLEADQAGRVANVFAAAISNSMANMTKIGDSMKYVAPVMRGLNMSVEETTATLGILYNAGLEASQAGTYLRSGMLRLQSPTKKAREALAKLGLSAQDVNPQIHSVTEIISKLEKAGAGAIDKGDELADIFGVRAVGAFQVLVQKGGGAITALEKKITGTSKASQMAARQVDTLSGSVKLMKSALEESAIQLGEVMAPVIRAVVDTIKNLSTAFNKLPSGIKTAIGILGLIVTALTGVSGIVAVILAMIPSIIAGIKAVGVAMTSSLGVVAAITIAITALAAAWVYFSGKQERQRKETLKSIESLRDAAQAAKEHKQEVESTADEFVRLAEKTERTDEENKKLKENYVKLRAEYPDLIKETDNYTDALESVKEAQKQAAQEVEKYAQIVAKTKLLELRFRLTEIRTELNDMQQDFRNVSNVEKFADHLTGAFDNVDASDAALQLGHLSDELNKLMTASTTGSITGNVVNLKKLVSESQKLANTTEGRTKLEQLSNSLMEEQAKQLEKLEDIRSGGQGVNSDAFEKQQERVNNINAVSTAINTVVGSMTEMMKLEAEEIQVQGALNDALDAMNGVKKEDKKITDKNIVTTNEDAKAKDNAAQKTALLAAAQEAQLKAQLALLKLSKDKSYEDDLKYIEKKQELESAALENDYTEKMAKARKLGVDVLAVEASFIQQRKALEAAQLEELNQMRKVWAEKGAALIATGMQPPDMVKKLVNDYEQALSEMDNVNPLAQLLNVDDNDQQNKFNELGNAMREQLQLQLLAVQEYSDEYYAIKKRLAELDRQLFEQNNKFIMASMQNVIKSSSDYLGEVADKMVMKWEGTKNVLGGLWMAIREGFKQMVSDMIKQLIKLAMQKAFLALIGSITGGQGGGVLAGVTGALQSNAYGGQVQRRGVTIVDKGERIVPAHVVRKEDSMLSNLIAQAKQDPNIVNNNQRSTQFVLNNPIVDEKDFWDKVYERHLIPAANDYQKRFK